MVLSSLVVVGDSSIGGSISTVRGFFFDVTEVQADIGLLIERKALEALVVAAMTRSRVFPGFLGKKVLLPCVVALVSWRIAVYLPGVDLDVDVLAV